MKRDTMHSSLNKWKWIFKQKFIYIILYHLNMYNVTLQELKEYHFKKSKIIVRK